ncbi:MAG TPA: hypothetical protein VIA98_09965 [Allosphingosinicella sp.]|jgi:hypothetical protein
MARPSFLRRGSAIDYALAGLAGAAFAFAAFALPEWRLTQLALGSGFAAVFPPAQPPLGFTARALFAGGVGAIALIGSYLLLRLADRPRVAKRETTEADAPPEPIRLRRADAHPDAPARRPLTARDLGEPAEEAPEELLLAPETEAPAFLVEQEPETVEAEPVEAATEPEAPLVWPPEPVAEEASESEPKPEPAPAPVPVPVETEAEAEPSITKLMQRLEFGLAKKERVVLDPAAVAAPADDAVGHRLRSAIGDLQKLAARG